MAAAVRPTAVAGSFYPDNPRRLKADVEGFLADAVAPADDGRWPKAIIAPHAGYVYSGPIAASAYALLKPARGTVNRVVLLGPSHRVAFRGLAVPSAKAFATPLGDIPIDRASIEAIAALPQVAELDDAHALEHSLEVHLPFLQTVLDGFSLAPVVVGDADADAVAEVLEILWGGPETVVVISSDLSHYKDYDTAIALDRQTVQAVERGDAGQITSERACGGRPIRGLLAFGQKRNLDIKLLDLRNSGDTAGTHDRVVGYASFSVEEKADDGEKPTAAPAAEFDNQLHARMGKLAYDAIRHGLETSRTPTVNLKDLPAEMAGMRACFVTLEMNGRLRGCIGSLAAHRPLATDITANAFAAAFQDRRFKPLTAAELEKVELSISVLSPSEEVSFNSQEDLLAKIRPGIDGLILEDKGRRGTFLPQVWKQLPESGQFLAHLKQKAGFSADYWSKTLKIRRYTTESFDVES